jgi:hypothetical protein
MRPDGERGQGLRRVAILVAPFVLIAAGIVAIFFSFSPTDPPEVLPGDPYEVWMERAAARIESRASPAGPRPISEVEPDGGPESRTVRLVVRDEGGAPIEGALALEPHREINACRRTGSEGRCTITIHSSSRAIQVGALRHEIADVVIPDLVPEVIPVVLRRAAGITVAVSVPDGCRPESFPVRLTDFDWGRDLALAHHPIHEAAGASHAVPGRTAENRSKSTYFPQADGHVTVTGIPPESEFHVSALDQLDWVRADAAVTLAKGEWRTVRLRVSGEPRVLAGVVRDVRGHPIEGATVRLDPASHETPGQPDRVRLEPVTSPSRGAAGMVNTTTDRAGAFEFRGIFASSVDVRVSRSGYALRTLEGVPVGLADPPLPLEVVLEKGCVLEVTVEDADGNPIPRLFVHAHAPGYPLAYFEGIPPGGGKYVLTEFPAGVTATIWVPWSGRKWTREVRVVGDHTERFVMPGTATVVVDWSAIPRESDMFLWLLPESRDQSPTGVGIPTPDPGEADVVQTEFTEVLPGDYTVTLQNRNAAALAVPEHVTVRAGQTMRLSLRKP